MSGMNETRPASIPGFPVADSENNPTREAPGSALQPNDHATPAAKRAGYGYAAQKGGSAMGGHNMDSANQYTVKLPRGSSL